jgi:hypothetical protein
VALGHYCREVRERQIEVPLLFSLGVPDKYVFRVINKSIFFNVSGVMGPQIYTVAPSLVVSTGKEKEKKKTNENEEEGKEIDQ